MKSHFLKTRSDEFRDMWHGLKGFEYRLNDRDFEIGDTLYLLETDKITEEYTGAVLIASVEYILHGGKFGIPKGYVIMGLGFAAQLSAWPGFLASLNAERGLTTCDAQKIV